MARRGNSSLVDSNALRWEPLEVPGSTGKAWIRTLSKDESTGGRTALIKFDPGFRQEKTVSCLPSDMYVVEGEMQCGDLSFQPDTFHYRPANTEYGPIDCPKGITRIVFTVDGGQPASTEAVFIPDVKQQPKEGHHLDSGGTRMSVSPLRKDPNGTISIKVHETWQVAFPGLPGLQHIHDHQEEYFVLAGEFWDYLGDVDGHVRSTPGYYACRPPNESSHGDSCAMVLPKKLILRLDLSTGKASMDTQEYGRDLELHTPSRPVERVAFVE